MTAPIPEASRPQFAGTHGSGGFACAAARVASLLAAGVGDEHVRQLAHDILARPEYARQRVQPVLTFKILEGVAKILRAFTAWMDNLWRESPGLYVAIVGGAVLLSLVLIGHVIYAVRRALLAGVKPEPQARPAGEVDLIAEADALAREGFHLEAAHRMQLAAIGLLVERGIVTLGRSEPNPALRSRLREAPLPAAERGELIAALDQFERRWFRDRTGDPVLYDRWRALYDRLRAVPAAA